MSICGDHDGFRYDDLPHSVDEERFIIIGISKRERLLLVAFTYRYEETVRIISARAARGHEAQIYNRGRRR